MSKVKRLIDSYGRYIAVPWRDDAAASQRVVFCVYPETEERRLRARIDEFELATQRAGHEWLLFDVTTAFARWMAQQKYAERYFQNPDSLTTVLPRYLDWIVSDLRGRIEEAGAGENHVVALQGVGSMFGFLKVKELVDRLAPLIQGRLVVLFPGSYENNNYRLLDGYDGWNYLATPITADKDY